MGKTVIVGLARTPFVGYGGALKTISAPELGATAISAAMARGGVSPEWIDYVFMGQVIQAGTGQIPSRQASMAAGLSHTVPSDTINKVCASSLRAVNLADMAIQSGHIRTAVAGGMESMSQAPYLVPGARWGLKMGDAPMVDSMVHDGLWCSFGQCHMGVYGSDVAKEFNISRAMQDDWALLSHQRAVAAQDQGIFADEMVSVSVAGKRGDVTEVSHDSGPRRDTSQEKLSKLRPVFVSDGTVTAGNAPGITDGASALVLMDEETARAHGLPILAEIVSTAAVSAEPKYLHTVPAYSALKALSQAGISVNQLKRVEINEAFAAVVLASMQIAEFPPDIVNVNGGAIALGHPIGASGSRILLTLVQELRRSGGGYGVAAICSGGGQGEATLVRVN